MSRVLVTGANGHVGCNVVRALLEAGHEPVPMVRASADTQGLDPLGLHLVRGDVRDCDAVRRAAEGCRFIVNLAAVFETRGLTSDEIVRPAIEGITNVIEAAAALGVERVVHASSTVAVGYACSPDHPRTAADWNEENLLPYHAAKTRSERRAWALAEQRDVPLVCVNPAGVLGQYDHRLTPTTRYVRDLVLGRAPTGLGGTGYVDARDAALAFVRAIDRGVPGERYIVATPVVAYAELGRLVSDLTGTPVRHLPVPRIIALGVVRVLGVAARLRGRPPPVSLEEARAYVGRYGAFDTTPARETLGVEPRPLRETLAHTIAWLLHRDALTSDARTKLAERFPPDPAWPAAG
jgi:dihydroflavonol-4-reductase